MKRSLVTLALFALAACGQSAGTYPPQYELNFMRACQAQGPVGDVCPCTWAKIEREIPPDEFAAFERLPTAEQAAHPLYTQIERFAIECTSQTDEAPEEPPAP